VNNTGSSEALVIIGHLYVNVSASCDRSVVSPVSSTNTNDHYNITEILLKSGIKHHKPNQSTEQSVFPKIQCELHMLSE
jgi:hypothetical protein